MSIAIAFVNKLSEYNIKIDKYYNFENKSLEEIELNNPPISFDIKGNPLSFWNDDLWNFNVFSKKKNDGLLNLSFYKEKLNKKLFQELKLLSLAITLNSLKSSIRSIKTTPSELIPIFESIQQLGFKSIIEINDSKNFVKMLENIKDIYSQQTISMKLIKLRQAENINLFAIPLNIGLNQKKRGFNDFDFSIEKLSKKYSRQENQETKQTLFIPQNIHSEIVSSAITVINRNLKDIDKIERFLEADYLAYENALNIVKNDDKYKSKSRTEQKTRANWIRGSKDFDIISGNELLFNLKLNKRFKKRTDLTDECRLLSTSCIILLLTFSGMRINEVLNIKSDGYKEINTKPKLHIIRSYETKISGGQTVDYITSPIIKDVVNVLNKLQSTTKKYDDSMEDKNNLFVSSNHQKLISYSDKSQIRKNMINFIKIFNIRLKKEDLKEHKLLNQSASLGINVDDLWKISSHQFRRTLIVNFVSHNLSSINEVKQQVKHMYATMTEYYANNSELVEYFNLKQPDSILDSIQEEILDENVRRYKNFYYSDDKLLGNKGKKIVSERQISDILSDEDIKLMFKTGAYKLTKSPYGYCTKGDECDKMGVVDPTFCGASCETMIITKENAEQWKKLYIRNEKLLNTNGKELIIGNLNMDGALTMMKAQNQVAKKILTEFGIEV